jgi:sulfur-carrier protein
LNVQLLFFAALRDACGYTALDVALPSEVRDVGSLRRWVAIRFPGIEGKLTSVRFAINEEFADDTRALAEADVVALIPPVCGG